MSKFLVSLVLAVIATMAVPMAVFAERFVYISSAGFCVVVGLGLAELSRRFSRSWSGVACAALLVSVTGALEAVTLEQLTDQVLEMALGPVR